MLIPEQVSKYYYSTLVRANTNRSAHGDAITLTHQRPAESYILLIYGRSTRSIEFAILYFLTNMVLNILAV